MSAPDIPKDATVNAFKPIREMAEEAEMEVDGVKENVNDQGPPVQEIESLCMNCHEQGVTRLLMTYIPFFKEIIVVSFRCEHCGYINNDIQSAGQIQDLGAVYTVKCTEKTDLDRQLVKSEHCLISIPEFQLQIPPGRGQLTTIEGIMSDTARDLEQDQALRRIQQPEVYEKIQTLVDQLNAIVATEHGATEPMQPFTLKVDDPSGNSFVEAHGGLNDPKWSKREYPRDAAQNEALGLTTEELTSYPEEVMTFPSECAMCHCTIDTLMKTVNIPHFKDIIIMSSACDNCGFRDNEVKSGGAVSPQARRITLRVEDSDDLSRDILKSDTASLHIPEIELELNPGTLGGRFTTLEGLLNQVYEELDEKVFAKGDSTQSAVGDMSTMERFLQNLKKAINVEMPYTVILDDALANSYIQNLYAPDPDPNLVEESYDRTFQQNEELGLNDIKTENYENRGKLAPVQEEEEEEPAAATAASTGAASAVDTESDAKRQKLV